MTCNEQTIAMEIATFSIFGPALTLGACVLRLGAALVFVVVVITCVELVPFFELDRMALPGAWDGVAFAVAGPGTDEKVEYAHGALPEIVGRAEEYPSQ